MNITLLNKLQNISRAKVLFMACLLGVVMGIIFIAVQPWFGMAALTGRHAALYQQLGHWNSVAAIVIAWAAHLAVSVFYGVLCGAVMLRTARVKFIALFTLVVSWLTTVIAPPANAIIVQLVSFQQIQFSKLPSLNFSLDVKFLLHLVFFVAISVGLYIYIKALESKYTIAIVE